MRNDTFPNLVLGGDTEMDAQAYRALYQESIDSPETFWGNQAKERLTFFEMFKTVTSGSLEKGDVKWFEEATLNVCYNCVDRHLETRADQTAIIWQEKCLLFLATMSEIGRELLGEMLLRCS